MDYSIFVSKLREYLSTKPSGYEFELAMLPFWGDVEQPTVMGKQFHKMFAESITGIECIGKPNNDNHYWYRKLH